MADEFDQETAESWLKSWLEVHNVVDAHVCCDSGPTTVEHDPGVSRFIFDVRWKCRTDTIRTTAYVYNDGDVTGPVGRAAATYPNKIDQE
jgi:hypothetical protein